MDGAHVQSFGASDEIEATDADDITFDRAGNDGNTTVTLLNAADQQLGGFVVEVFEGHLVFDNATKLITAGPIKARPITTPSMAVVGTPGADDISASPSDLISGWPTMTRSPAGSVRTPCMAAPAPAHRRQHQHRQRQ